MYTNTVLAITTLFAAGTQAICSHNTHLYDRAAAAQFTYTGLTGPLNWHSLSPNNTACAKGKHQTPINLDSGISTKSGAGYIANYPTTLKAKYENLGTTVEVLGDSIGGSVTFEGTTYQLLQFHFHTPSEHRIDDEHFPLEVHFVHRSAAGTLAVVGFPIDIGSSVDPLLYQVLSQTDKIPAKDNEYEIGPLPFTSIVNALKSGTVYRYKGSLTTPGCSEGVEWVVVKKPLLIDYLTYNKVKKVVKFNSRYTQNTPGQINLLENAKNTVP